MDRTLDENKNTDETQEIDGITNVRRKKEEKNGNL